MTSPRGQTAWADYTPRADRCANDYRTPHRSPVLRSTSGRGGGPSLCGSARGDCGDNPRDVETSTDPLATSVQALAGR
jgi:hypothetical protein